MREPKVLYPGQVATTDPLYPSGKARNIITPGDGVGTPFEEKWVNDHFGAQQEALARAGITPNGLPEGVGQSQFVDALVAASRDGAAAKNWNVAFEDLRGSPLTSFDVFTQRVATLSDGSVVVMANGGAVWRSQTLGIEKDNFSVIKSPISGAAGSGIEDVGVGIDDAGTEYTWVVDAAGQVYKSTNRGDTWNNAGTIDATILRLGYWPTLGLFVAAGTNELFTSPDLQTWTERGMPGAWATWPPERIIASPQALVIVPNQSLVTERTSVLVSTDGIAYSEVPTENGINTISGAAYSAARDQWLVGSIGGTPALHLDIGNGTLSSGLTEVSVLDAGTDGFFDIGAVGTAWVISSHKAFYVSTDNAQTWERISIPGIPETASDQNYPRFLQHQGRILAFRRLRVGSGNATLRVITSGRA